MRRTLALIALLLLAGAIVNIAVAWGCALWIEGMPVARAPFDAGVSAPESPRWDIRLMVVQPGSAVASYDAFTVLIGPPRPLAADADHVAIQRWVERMESWNRGEIVPRDSDVNGPIVAVPWWSGATRPPTPAEIDRMHYHEDARGWPLLSMVTREEQVRDVAARMVVSSRHRWGIRLRGVQGPLGLPRVLPLRPIGFNFAINTMFYAAVLGGMFFMMRVLRRKRRLRRGLCPACAYPIGVSEVCTECGHPVPRRDPSP